MNDPRWPIANISGLQLSVKAWRTRGRHTFRQILVAHRAEDPQWRNHTGRQSNFRGRHSSSTGALARQLSEQSEQVWSTHKGPQHDTRAQHSGCDGTSARQRSTQRHRVNGTSSPSD